MALAEAGRRKCAMSVERAHNLYELPERFERLSRSMAEMLSQLIEEANELVARTEGTASVCLRI
jgi:primase-polymerase (primpol)-like protein